MVKISFEPPSGVERESPAGLPLLSTYRPKETSDAVVIDAGSWQFRAGYASHQDPALVFDPIVHRIAGRGGDVTQFQVGRALPAGASRSASRTPFEESNVVQHIGSLEHVLDHVFSSLKVKVGDGSILHPVAFSEPIANPPICRREVSELLFEAYGTPSLLYGIDSLYSYYEHAHSVPNTALVISVGNQSTTMICIVDGKIHTEGVKRINFGGSQASSYLLRLMQCKYPTFPTKVSLPQAQQIMHQACQFADDYNQVLDSLATDEGIETRNATVQFPYSIESVSDVQKRAAEQEALAAKRREQAQKLRERAERLRQEKLENKKKQVESMRRLLKQVLGQDEEAQETATDQLHLYGYDSVDDLQSSLVGEERELNRLLGIEEPKEAPDYSLLEVPDAQLGEAQVKEKRKQRLLKNSAEARERIRREKEEREKQEADRKAIIERRRLDDFAGWRDELYRERKSLVEKIKTDQRKRDALADRRSQVAGARLRDVVSLVADPDEDADKVPQTAAKSNKRSKTNRKNQNSGDEDTFGADDADWLIYREISREVENEAAEEWQRRITEIEEDLEKFDSANFYDTISSELSGSRTIMDKLRNGPIANSESTHQNAAASQIHLNVERFRPLEALFQPSAIMGIDQSGLIETLENLLRQLPPSTQDLLVNNIFITGGISQLPGISERLIRELRSMLPAELSFNLSFSANPLLDSWKGAARLIRDHSKTLPWITRDWYQENGGDRLPSTSWFTNQF